MQYLSAGEVSPALTRVRPSPIPGIALPEDHEGVRPGHPFAVVSWMYTGAPKACAYSIIVP